MSGLVKKGEAWMLLHVLLWEELEVSVCLLHFFKCWYIGREIPCYVFFP